MKHPVNYCGQRLATIAAMTILTGTIMSQAAFSAQPPQGPGGGPGGFGGPGGGPGGPGGFRGPGGPGGPGGFRGPGGRRPISLAMIPGKGLASALNLSDGQVSRINSIQKRLQEQRQNLMPAPGQQPDGPPDWEAMEANREKMRTLEQKAAGDIEAVLTAEQKSAVPELLKILNVLGRAGVFPELIGDLKLTVEQRKQLAALPAPPPPPRPGGEGREGGVRPNREGLDQNRQQANQQVMAILTAEQKKLVEAFRQSQAGRGPGGGGRGPRPGGGGFGPPPGGGGFGPPPGSGFGGPPPPEQQY